MWNFPTSFSHTHPSLGLHRLLSSTTAHGRARTSPSPLSCGSTLSPLLHYSSQQGSEPAHPLFSAIQLPDSGSYPSSHVPLTSAPGDPLFHNISRFISTVPKTSKIKTSSFTLSSHYTFCSFSFSLHSQVSTDCSLLILSLFSHSSSLVYNGHGSDI